MLSNPTAALVLERLPSGEPAWLRPETATSAQPEPKFIPRDQLPRFIVTSQTVYLVYAETAERALQWFADESDTDIDVEPLDFGKVELVGELSPEDPIDVEDARRYWITSKGRRALAEAEAKS